jgi:hypothetical protein
MIITRDQLSSIKLNQLSEFMRSEILQYNIGKWNNHSPSSIKINLPLIESTCELNVNNTPCISCQSISQNSILTLDKITFRVEEAQNKVFNLKDYWPVNGADLAIKAEEGTIIRSLLGLESDQEIKILSLNKPTPQSSQSSIVSELDSMNTRSLFYNSSNGSSLTTLQSAETKPNTFTVEEYHAYFNKPLPQEPLLENEVFPRRFQNTDRLVHIRGDIWTHSTIYEGSNESLITSSNNRASANRSSSLTNSTVSLVNYRYPQNTNPEFRNAILDMMNEIDTDLAFLNNTNNPEGIARTNTGESTLVNSSSNTSEETYFSPTFQGNLYRSTSPLSVRASSPVSYGSNTIITSTNLEHNLANDVD